METSAELHLRWSSYESTLIMSVSDLWDAGAMTDVTLSAEGRSIKAHKVVLSACSGWFKEVLQDITPAQHPIIVLPFACYEDLSSVIQFMYKGEINITQMKLPGLLGCAESLKVKGLAKINPHRASGLLNEAIISDCSNQSSQHRSKRPKVIKRETGVLCAKSSLSYGEDEEAIEITEISEECEDNLIMDEDSSVPGGSDGGHDSEGCDDSNLSGSEQSEGKLYFLTSLGQHGEIAEDEDEGTNHLSPPAKQKNRRRLYRAISAAWNSGRSGTKEHSNNSQRSVIRKTLMPVSCPVCFKVLSNAYNLKVHMSIHDGLMHQCSICGHTSKSRDALRKHLAYRHLIGMSGPVRPRMPSSKRKRTGGTDGDETDQPPHSNEMDEIHISTAPTPTYSDPENDLANSGVEDVANNHRPHQPVANTSS